MTGEVSHAQGQLWDAIVIGTGVGGATIGHALARLGRRVLFIEKGHHFSAFRHAALEVSSNAEDPETRLDFGHWPLPLRGETSFGRTEFFAPLGCGSGGSSNLYASQLERMRPSDFAPRQNHPGVSDSTLPERWPFEYDELLPYYRRAESLYEVSGSEDPLQPDPQSVLLAPPEMTPRDAYVFDTLASCGLHPYRAHVGARFVAGCNGCGGTLCDRSCKSDSGRVCLRPALEHLGATILSDCEVLRIDATDSHVERVICQRNGETFEVSSKFVVLAAGAFMTPAILLRSRSQFWENGLCNRFDCVGRNLMMHASEVVAIRPPEKLPADGPRKAISVNDFYLKDGRKLGTLQSMGISVNAGIIANYLDRRVEKDATWYLQCGSFGRKVLARISDKVFHHSVVMVAIIEDLPYWGNRIVLDESAPNGLHFEYTYPDELRERSEAFRSLLKEALSKRLTVMRLNGANNLNFGHICGTCRAGIDPQTSVVDRNGRSHDVENLFIADASIFPSSGGTNPSLTIAANALRTADVIHRELHHD